MQYRTYGKLGYEVSALGMGCMRLPRIYHDDGTASVDKDKAIALIQYAADNGINYFDSAWTYHHQTSESVLGEALDGGRRGRVKIVTKLILSAISEQSDIRKSFEITLKKLRTDFLDVYLVHNITDSTWPIIERRGIYDEFAKLKAEGLIGAVGFSFHGTYPVFEKVLARYPWDMCQVQQNMLDVNREATEQAIHLAGKKGVALAIMEPLRGGGLCAPPPSVQAVYNEYPATRPGHEWAFRHVLNYPEVSTVLSGMNTMEQLKENIALFSRSDTAPGCLNSEEKQIIVRAREAYEALANIPCTRCEYCMPCPNGVNIPEVFFRYNEGAMFGFFPQAQRAYMLMSRAKSQVIHCVQCGLCETKCPQKIAIMRELQRAHDGLTGWIE